MAAENVELEHDSNPLEAAQMIQKVKKYRRNVKYGRQLRAQEKKSEGLTNSSGIRCYTAGATPRGSE